MYDPSLSYEENYDYGPFERWCFPSKSFPNRDFVGIPRYSFFGNPVFLPFGIPAGPLLNSRFVRVAWNAGVSTCTYKTVRSRFWKSHPYPNVLRIRTADGANQISSEHALRGNIEHPKVWGEALSADSELFNKHPQALAISNSFGVPSKEPAEWQEDVRQCFLPGPGRCLVISFQGTRIDSEDFAAFVLDTCLAQRLAYQAFLRPEGLLQQIPVLEVNLSCPNELGRPIFTDVGQTLQLLAALKAERQRFAHEVKLIAKIGALSQHDCDRLVLGAKGLVDGIAAINTVTAEIQNSQSSKPALGSGMLTGGVCGELIFDENLAMVKRLATSRRRFNVPESELAIVSVGGINTVGRFMEVLEAGASHAQSATACMWNLDLCEHIAARLNVKLQEICLDNSNCKR